MNNYDKNLFSLKKSHSGLGLFTNIPIKKGEFIIEYTGKLLTRDKTEERGGRYLFELNSRWTVDGSERKNLSRYINHGCYPNCKILIKNRRINIHALRNIKAGEELTYNYGKEYFNAYIKPSGCKCKKCRIK